MNDISQTLCRVENGDSYAQFQLISHYQIEDESIRFTLSEYLTSDLERFPDRRDALRVAANEILGQEEQRK